MAEVIDKLAWLHLETVNEKRCVLFARSRGQELFYCVGGKREGHETDKMALIREVYQETCGVLVPESIEHLRTFEGPAHGRPGATLRMACYTARYQGQLSAASEVEELALFTTADIPRTTEMGRDVLLWLQEQNLID